MIKFRISLLYLLLLSHHNYLLILVTSTQDVSSASVSSSATSNDSTLANKSSAALWKRHKSAIDPESKVLVSRKIDSDNYDNDDQNAIASERIGARYLPPPSSISGGGGGGGYFEQNSVNCHTCNSVPWIPIIGRSLKLNSPQSSHFNSFEDNNHHHQHQQKSQYFNQKPFYPPIDQYGAPQATYMYPPLAEVVDFMLPPPFKLRNIYKPSSKTKYFPPKLGPVQSGSYPRPTLSSAYGSSNVRPLNSLPTTHLRPVSQDFQPPSASLHVEHNHIPPPPPSAPLPSDSYGNVLDNLLAPPQLSDSYGTPIQTDHNQYIEPLASGSSENENYDKRPNYNNFIRQEYFDFHRKVPNTNVQVVPSVIVADYTASVEHPINLIQSPILDLNINQGEQAQHTNDKQSLKTTLKEHPIVVPDDGDSYAAASSRTSTNSSTTISLLSNSTTTKRHNDKDIGTNAAENVEGGNLSDSLIQNLIRDQNIITDPKNQIISIKKVNFDPSAVGQHQNGIADPNYWSSLQSNTISTVMVPPKPNKSQWSTSSTQNYTQAYRQHEQQPPLKNSKKLQIIVPYLKAPEKELMWLKQLPKSTAIYNKEYSTLAPIFIPPPMSTEVTNLWTKLAEDMRIVELQKEEAQGFSKMSTTTTEVYNIKDFLKTRNDEKKPTDGISMDIINDWTQQFYAPTNNNNNNNLNFGERVRSASSSSSSQGYAKRATTTFTTTPVVPSLADSFDFHDHLTANSDNNPFISKEVEENLLLPLTESTTTPMTTVQLLHTTTPTPNIRYIVNETKSRWPQMEKITLSNSTHEKVYVVTPQSYVRFLTSSTPATAFSMAPKIQNGKINDAPPTMTRISVRVESPPEVSGTTNNGLQRPVKVVYSEWPHLINNLETTTQKTTTRHPLFGLMDLAPYTVSYNGTVETIGGHSKVTSATSPLIPESTQPPPPPLSATKIVSA